MTLSAIFNRAMRISLLILLTARVAPAQTAEPKEPAGQDSTQQPSQQRPKVFFPMADQPRMEMHHHGNIHEVMPQFPRLGNSQRVVSGSIVQLEDLDEDANFKPVCTPTRSSGIAATRFAAALMGAARKDFSSSNQSFLAANSV
jgi:hypothetical protein